MRERKRLAVVQKSLVRHLLTFQIEATARRYCCQLAAQGQCCEDAHVLKGERREGRKMPQVEAGITIHAPVEKVFAYLQDPESNPEWLPGMIAVKGVVMTEDGIGSSFGWVYKMAGIQFEGKSTTVEFEPDRRFVVQSEGGIASTWSWTFAAQDDGTKLDLVIDYRVPIPVLGKLAEALVLKQNEREANLAMVNIKARMEA